MPAIPLPFIVTAVLLVLLLEMLRARQGAPLFALFVAACALQTGVVGLRWSVDPAWVRMVQPVLAACLPPLALAAFNSLRGRKVSLVGGLWPLCILGVSVLRPIAIDPVLILEFALYGLIIMILPLPEDALKRVRLGDEWTVTRARYGVAALLLLSAVVDTVVAVMLAEHAVANAAPAIAAMMGIMLVGLAAVLLRRTVATLPDTEAGGAARADARRAYARRADAGPTGRPAGGRALADAGQAEAREAEAPRNEELDRESAQRVLLQVEAALAGGLYRDHDLTLQRIARRTGITARKISYAVNRFRGCTVTDLVNGYRVREAMRLLRESDLPVTEVMLDAGFQTKSNFNRAFRAVAGRTPSAYRQSENG
ncbi:AraC family transcriptional regulator [Pseudooceanicola sediminis]|uniref:AraC family transcriptional regulator n=1 Tax=Pseudooceanicola sediminis TaxID=2211117 RepID=A0A399IWB0_9RHOB|nr:AraC family transcriptional regulator [Pseudooceanicola sediminis]KAA2312403.1 helix-turn-helix transcriptional regulator [Puniceibacterium sp. HSS470]RII37453.1 AraC family transcriptional regulator [Pseudooceanicola sediminis]|tara:strand:- start:18982 stop:20088 length:1107 start_codon:yes stop_codon:yes gene_type:complete